MKKLISLLLVLVLSLGMLSGISMAAEPAQCTEDEAVIKVTCGDDGEAYFYPELSFTVVRHVTSKMTSGARTITFLKDIDSSETKAKTTKEHSLTRKAILDMGSNTADWGKKNFEKLTIDLNGHTWTYTGDANLIYGGRYGCTVKNGTINYCNTGANDQHVFGDGFPTGPVMASKPFNPKFILEKVTINDTSANEGHAAFMTHNFESKYTMKDCTIYVANGDVMNFTQSTQENAVNSKGEPLVHNGGFNSSLTVTNSTFLTPKGALVSTSQETPDTATVNVEDTLVVGAVKGATCNATVAGAEPTVVEGYAATAGNGTAVTATAYVYGDPAGYKPAPVKLPFTDVKEGDWFYSFVSELYNQKIIAGQTATTFNPNGNLTYAAAIKLLVVGLTGNDSGNAASGHWASNYLAEATVAGWTTIGADKLDAPITREAFCEIAAAAAALTEQPAENKFTDTQNTAVLALVKAGVINGMNETTFAPTNVLTRAQISKIISLLLKL